MCGIAGIVSLNKQNIYSARLLGMTARLAHRGPDAQKVWISDSGQVGLGHRRLSIIDLSEQAAQPMHYLNRYTIVFNGEIYNYVEIRERLVIKGYHFATQSDTEVLLALYDNRKEKCLEELDGMFAFAIYDGLERKLFCARDRFGEKPFYYHYQKGGHFIFASEMKALWAAGVKRETDESMLYNYLQYGFVWNPANPRQTFFKEIQQLKPSHYLLVDLGTITHNENSYWEIPVNRVQQSIGIEETSTRFHTLLSESVKRRLRSDVPVGSSLSGGLDSSALVCLINELNPEKIFNQRTFSAQFPGFDRDETRFQNLVTNKVKAEAYAIRPTETELLNEIEKLFYHQEEPFASASIMAQYLVYKLAREKNTPVLIDGQGADEVLAGYHHYFLYYFIELTKRGECEPEWQAYRNLHQHNPVNATIKKDAKFFLLTHMSGLFEELKKAERYIKKRRGILSRDFYNQYSNETYFYKSNFDSLDGILKHDALGGALQNLLRYADRNAMAHSVEVRLPFLSHELVEFLFTLPAGLKIRQGWTKYILRKSLEKLLPPEICWRKDKLGYEPPQKSWMSSPGMQEAMYENKKALVAAGILDKRILEKEIEPVAAVAQGQSDWHTYMAGMVLNKRFG